MKQSEVEISLNHDIMASFLLLKWPWIPKSGANLAGVMVSSSLASPKTVAASYISNFANSLSIISHWNPYDFFYLSR
jgi:hypothetical protein